MIRPLLTLVVALLMTTTIYGQLITSLPLFPTMDDEVTITFDATLGTGGLADCNCDVYLHTGVITDESSTPSDWKNVQTDWGVSNSDWRMTPVPGEPNKYTYTISPSIREYYNIQPGTTVEQMAFVFRNGDGSLEGKGNNGSDIFVEVFPDNVPFTLLLLSPEETSLITTIGATIPVEVAATAAANITITVNGTEVLNEIAVTEASYDVSVTEAGAGQIVITATNGVDTQTIELSYATASIPITADPPANSRNGITYLNDSSVRLQLFAPNKDFVYVIGDFNNYQLSDDYLMQRSTDEDTHWIEITGLTPGEYYSFQYWVDGEIKIADPYSELVLDPNHDPWIPEVTWPNLPDYPSGKTTGITSLIQPGAPEYDWQVNDFERPDKMDLVVYELLLRDFIARHDYETLIDTLDYLDRLGINAIELMPVQEFEGNESWGYNPSFHGALDKYYGTPNEFKRFVDECHARGIAVVVDVVYNHAFAQSPLCQLYWDNAQFRPTADNPWFNQEATHPFNVGYDFNHESPATVDFVERMIEYWLDEYRIDGYRFDLSKGFTQTNTGGNVGAWSNYDASRVAIVKNYADKVWETSPGAYVILEHFGQNSEEKEYAEYGEGMMMWANAVFNYNQMTMGYDDSDVSWIWHVNRNWGQPGLMGYMESHDEERLMYKNLAFGNSSADGNYDVTVKETALERMALGEAFFFTIPGPKMMWQFAELGYDHSIFTCSDGTVQDGNDGCKLSNKPIRWDYQEDGARQKLYDITRSLIHLKTTYDVFETDDATLNLSNDGYKVIHLDGDDFDVAVIGNVSVQANSIPNPFPYAGTWYDYFTGEAVDVSNPSAQVILNAGGWRLFTSMQLEEPPGGYLTSLPEVVDNYFKLTVTPNPATGPIQVSYNLPNATQVQLDLFNIAGSPVGRLVQERQPAGEHNLNEALDLPTGTYILRMIADGKVESRKIMVTR